MWGTESTGWNESMDRKLNWFTVMFLTSRQLSTFSDSPHMKSSNLSCNGGELKTKKVVRCSYIHL